MNFISYVEKKFDKHVNIIRFDNNLEFLKKEIL